MLPGSWLPSSFKLEHSMAQFFDVVQTLDAASVLTTTPLVVFVRHPNLSRCTAENQACAAGTAVLVSCGPKP
jgi:hypothetical protein